jgi:glycosylphosphatidylinositol transamidase
MNIKIEGLNGQLPNLDLVNTVVKLCSTQGITPALHKRPDSRNFLAVRHYVTTMLHMMMAQASGMPSANHGLFLPFHIEALTLHGVKMKGGKSVTLDEVALVVEGVFRSLNNLLERFHQSFFFYLLPSTDRYVSIGLYMPPFGLMALPLVIKVFSLN